MTTVQSDYQDMHASLASAMMKRMAAFEEQLKTSREPASIDRLSQEFSDFKKHVYEMLSLLQKEVSMLARVTDELDMRHRRKCLILHGVPEDPKEVPSVVVQSILKDKLKMESTPTSTLKACHRLGESRDGRIRPLLIRFTDHSVKSVVWKKKTHLKGTPIVMSEFLTRNRQFLFMTARHRFGVTNCWTLDGNIYVKDRTGKRHKLVNEEELSLISGVTVQAPVATAESVGDCPSAVSAAGPSKRPRRVVKQK